MSISMQHKIKIFIYEKFSRMFFYHSTKADTQFWNSWFCGFEKSYEKNKHYVLKLLVVNTAQNKGTHLRNFQLYFHVWNFLLHCFKDPTKTDRSFRIWILWLWTWHKEKKSVVDFYGSTGQIIDIQFWKFRLRGCKQNTGNSFNSGTLVCVVWNTALYT